ncbi:uncharacterized protein LOC121266443 [Juglans microcarpa x Juglans regia]|uniref:uncharacterized protein LOC121266443 n=1 Tax=Juglans microcarpa x Juglans regia TaxID=2249226 RepID=UPI001B7E0B26|nr:uncharacterized protein LOC121266443 [Juglans microcarpa x Juglans regia]
MMENAKLKHLSTVANDVFRRCALKLGTSVDKLVEEFEAEYWKPDEISTSNISSNGYSRKLVEFCSAKAFEQETCQNIEEKINDGSFSRFTFDMMIAWEMPSSADEEASTECVAKEREDKKIPVKVDEEQDDIPLFYSDLMLLLVDDGPNVGEDGFAWFASLVPLVADPVNARFTFNTLTTPTGNRLFFPAYDKFLKEIDKCTKHLQKQATPKGVELAYDEVILHVEGTATSQRVIRHIGATSWPGRLTLTNYAIYFEASGVITYEGAFKIDLSKDTEHRVRTASTGPWGAPLFDKAIVYESPELSEAVVLEFPEVVSSTRRDHWLALIKEFMLMHRFLSKYKVECRTQAWEMHARTILGIIRLHAARELLRISAPAPTKFLIFALFDEFPKGDYILEELAESLKKVNSRHPCSASSILMGLNMSLPIISDVEAKAVGDKSMCAVALDENQTTLETVINQAREEEKNIAMAQATTEGLKEEGIAESAFIFKELLTPPRSAVLWFQEILTWERPATTLTVLATTLIIIYKEWVGKAIASFLLWVVAKMFQARRKRINERCNEIVVCTASDQTTIESIVSAQHGLQTVHQLLRKANIAVLKLWSIFISKTREHADMVMIAMIGLAILLAVIPLKFLLMVGTLCFFSMTSKLGKHSGSYQDQGSRRLKEWWDSIPVIPVRVVDKPIDSPTCS